MTEEEINRSAPPRPKTFDPVGKSVELTLATTADPGDGYRLNLDRLPDFGPAPVPVLLDHASSVDRMAGRLADIRIERGALVARALFVDAPGAQTGLELARSGIAASVAAAFRQEDTVLNLDGTRTVMRWRLRHVALVPEGADRMALTRSAHPNPYISSKPMDEQQTQASEPQPTRAELKRHAAIFRAAGAAGLSAEQTDALVRSDRSEADCLVEIVRSLRLAQEKTSLAGHPAQIPVIGNSTTVGACDGLSSVVERAVRGQPLNEPLAYTLRRSGYAGRSDEDVLRSALTGRADRYINRSAAHSTSDFPALLLASGDRMLQERYAAPARGIRALARIRPLQDFREVSAIDVGLVGSPKAINEGGEITFTTVAESKATYKAKRHGFGLQFTYEAFRNDDLGGLGVALEESMEAHLGVEADSLVALLSGSGATAPDGQPLFHSSHNNSVAAAMTVDGLSAAVKLLRAQKSIGGRLIAQDPGVLLVGPDREAEAAALLSDLWHATTAQDVNPWQNLQLIVEPSLAGLTYYLVASGPRKPFELGQLVGLPRMLQDEDFATSSIRFKTESAHGCAVCDFRPIVRVTAPSA